MNRLLRIFVTGLLAALPLLATLLILVWTVRLAVSWVGPDSLVGGALSAIGLGVTGSEVAGYALGIVVVAVVIFALGLLVEAGLERGLARIVDAIVGRIPVVRTVYDMLQRFVALVSTKRDDDGLKSMSPVWCHFGGPGGAAVLALLSTPEPIDLLGARFVGVVVPSAPVPVGGALVYVPEAWITPADIGVEALTSIYVSMGVTSSQQLGGAAAKLSRAPGSLPPGT
jgi:uncharacterized membrane protein